MNTGYYDQGLLDVILQSQYEMSLYTIYEAFCFGSILADLCEGRILKADSHLHGSARPDEDIEGNQRLLDSLPDQFYGSFRGKLGDADGHVG